MAAARQRLAGRVLHWGHVADRQAYAAWLWQSDVVVSTARQEFFGVAVAEAICCGCQPVLPHRLAYPELVPAEHHDALLYRDFDGLVARLRAALLAPDPRLAAALRVRMVALDWSVLAPRYDAALTGMVESSTAPGLDRRQP
jgi:glycosyltransferase involved in cell wall biosynthesis